MSEITSGVFPPEGPGYPYDPNGVTIPSMLTLQRVLNDQITTPLPVVPHDPPPEALSSNGYGADDALTETGLPAISADTEATFVDNPGRPPIWKVQEPQVSDRRVGNRHPVSTIALGLTAAAVLLAGYAGLKRDTGSYPSKPKIANAGTTATVTPTITPGKTVVVSPTHTPVPPKQPTPTEVPPKPTPTVEPSNGPVWVITNTQTPEYDAPGGTQVGSLNSQTAVVAECSANGWTKLQNGNWVPTKDLSTPEGKPPTCSN